MPNDGNLRVWWIPQVPMTAFIVPVRSEREALLILDTLGRYDLFQLENNIKPDYCNAGGVEIYEDDQWTDWHKDDETGRWSDFDEYADCVLRPEEAIE